MREKTFFGTVFEEDSMSTNIEGRFPYSRYNTVFEKKSIQFAQISRTVQQYGLGT